MAARLLPVQALGQFGVAGRFAPVALNARAGFAKGFGAGGWGGVGHEKRLMVVAQKGCANTSIVPAALKSGNPVSRRWPARPAF
jgi:hypothetical protein